jgi:hypothetical protein
VRQSRTLGSVRGGDGAATVTPTRARSRKRWIHAKGKPTAATGPLLLGNIEPIIRRKKTEDRRVLCAFASMGECPVAVLWVRRSETNRPSKCLEDTRGELARKGLTHRRMSNDSPKIKWSCQRINEQVGVGTPRQFSGRDGLLDQV